MFGGGTYSVAITLFSPIIIFSRRINALGKNVSVCVTVMDILLGKNNNEMDVEGVVVKNKNIYYEPSVKEP